LSDRIGREITMFIAFMLAAVSIGSLAMYGHDPMLFLITGGLIYFTWGEIYSLFPATCTDIYGFQYATTNAGMLYTAKGTAALLVPLSNLVSATGDWHGVLWMGALGNIIAAFLAIFVLRPMRAAHGRRQSAPSPLRVTA
jgi:MFS transporter, OFA family, oxalate/formate antiporter